MQNHHRISLNAIRVFACVADHTSISGAAAELGVTPSAVSHQVKNLETSLGFALFARGHNSIALTEDGEAFLADAQPGLRLLQQATEVLTRDNNDVTVCVSSTLAVRWLIPALDRFKEQYPAARVKIETSRSDQIQLRYAVDMVVTYYPTGAEPAGGQKILSDLSRPVLSPSVLRNLELSDRNAVLNIPAIMCTDNNWDWRRWAAHSGLQFDEMKFTDHFDIDDAALHAATAGLGMVLSPEFMIRPDINAGTLIALPGFEPIEMGGYYLVTGPRTGGIIAAFQGWLLNEAAKA